MSHAPARAAAVLVALLAALPAVGASHDPTVVHKPDLWPAAPQTQGGDEREPTTVCFDVVNFAPQGQGRVTTSYTVGLRVDRRVDGTYLVDREAQARSREFLAGTQMETFCFSFPLVAGSYRAYATVDAFNEVDEANETNNVQIRPSHFVVDDRPLPDLVFLSSSVTPREGITGVPQQFRFLVANRGDDASASTTAHMTDASGLNVTLPVPALPPGGYAELRWKMMPDDRPWGEFVARVVLDPEDAILERNETNNEALRGYAILPHPLPDLRIVSAAFQGKVESRRDLTLDVVVANDGNRSASDVTIRVYDGDPSLGNATLANATIPYLGVGLTAPVRVTFNLTAGERTILVFADPDFRIGELNEDNNTLQLLVDVAALAEEDYRPNLIVERFSALPEDPAPGESVALSAYIRNDGELATEPTLARFLIDGSMVAEVNVPKLLPGRYHHASFDWKDHSLGAHAFRILVDPADTVLEIDERDNDQLIFASILAPRADASGDGGGAGGPDGSANEGEGAPPEEGAGEGSVGGTPPVGEETPPPAQATGDRIEIAQVDVGTRTVPGGVKGTIVAQLRNPLLEPVPRVTLAFKVDNKTVKEILVDNIPAAGLVAKSSGEIDLPEGDHAVSVEVRIPGDLAFVATAGDRYDTPAGEKPVPGASLLAVLAGVALLAAMRRKKADD